MGILRDFEKRLEKGVEGFFARAFRSGLQPVELAKAAQRYASNYQQVGVDGVFVPNVYRFELAPEDCERFSSYGDSLKRELGAVVRRTCRERGWRLQGPVRIDMVGSDDISVGTYELRGKVEAAEQAEASARPAAVSAAGSQNPSATAILPTQSATAYVKIVDGPERGRRVRVNDRMVIGRLGECDLRLDDPSVSRRHARLVRADGSWQIEDLGSTNGVRVNGSAVEQSQLSHGDAIELGSVRLSFDLEG